jgi:hypothetical protein
MAVRLSAIVPATLYPQEDFWYSFLFKKRGWVDPRAIVRLEGLGHLKNPMTSSGIEPATFLLVALCLSHLRYRVPPLKRHLCACRTRLHSRRTLSRFRRWRLRFMAAIPDWGIGLTIMIPVYWCQHGNPRAFMCCKRIWLCFKHTSHIRAETRRLWQWNGQ